MEHVHALAASFKHSGACFGLVCSGFCASIAIIVCCRLLLQGSEIIRLYHTLLGAEGFRKGMDLYFQRHDGQVRQPIPLSRCAVHYVGAEVPSLQSPFKW
jgi:hypothetical protein